MCFKEGRGTTNFGLRAAHDGPAAGRVDLLSVLEHEIGYLPGLNHADPGSGSIMEETLGLETRWLPNLLGRRGSGLSVRHSQEERQR